MNTAIEQLRKLVLEGKESIPNRGVRTFTLLQELTFIENRRLVDYFLAMHRYVKELKSLPDVLIGPGRRWMTASHVCHALGITNICLGSISLAPIDFWGDEDSDTTMDIGLMKTPMNGHISRQQKYLGMTMLPANQR